MRYAEPEPSVAATRGFADMRSSSVDPDPGMCRVSGNATLPHRRHARTGGKAVSAGTKAPRQIQARPPVTDFRDVGLGSRGAEPAPLSAPASSSRTASGLADVRQAWPEACRPGPDRGHACLLMKLRLSAGNRYIA
jgi:hypothetical protein